MTIKLRGACCRYKPGRRKSFVKTNRHRYCYANTYIVSLDVELCICRCVRIYQEKRGGRGGMMAGLSFCGPYLINISLVMYFSDLRKAQDMGVLTRALIASMRDK